MKQFKHWFTNLISKKSTTKKRENITNWFEYESCNFNMLNDSNSIESNPIFLSGLNIMLSILTGTKIRVILGKDGMEPTSMLIKNFLLTFLESPNNEESGKSFRNKIFYSLLTNFESKIYLYWNDDIINPKFYLIDSTNISENRDINGIISSYKLINSGDCVASFNYYLEKKDDLNVNKRGLIMEIKSNKHKSLIEVAKPAIELFNMQLHKLTLEVQANSIAQIKITKTSNTSDISNDDIEKYRNTIKQSAKSLSNDIRVVNSTGKFDIIKISNIDPEFDSIKPLKDLILISMGIPPEIVNGGSNVEYRAKRSNYQMFIHHTINPFLETFISQIKHHFDQIFLNKAFEFGLISSNYDQIKLDKKFNNEFCDKSINMNLLESKQILSNIILEIDHSSTLWFNESAADIAKDFKDVSFIKDNEKRKFIGLPANTTNAT